MRSFAYLYFTQYSPLALHQKRTPDAEGEWLKTKRSLEGPIQTKATNPKKTGSEQHTPLIATLQPKGHERPDIQDDSEMLHSILAILERAKLSIRQQPNKESFKGW